MAQLDTKTALELQSIGWNNLCSTQSRVKAWEINDTVKLETSPINKLVAQTSKDISEYLASRQPNRTKCSQIFHIPQEHSRGNLCITTQDLDALLSKIEAFPSLRKVINAFERDGSDYHQGLADVQFTPIYGSTPSTIEFCTLLKYAEANRAYRIKPTAENYDAYEEVKSWSIRQMALYQSYDVQRSSETILLVNASDVVITTLSQTYRDESRRLKPYDQCLQIPQLMLETLCANWSTYIAALHRAVEEVMHDANFTEPSQLRVGEANAASLQKCADLIDRLHCVSHVVGNNLFILEAIMLEIRKRQAVLSQPTEAATDAFEESILSVSRELKLHHNQVHLITARLERTTAKIRDLLSLRNSYIMEQMTARSILEARAVRVIALVTLCFLPPTFTTGLLAMDGFNISKSPQGHLIMDANPSFLFFLALTLPLLTVTVGGWLIWDRMSLRKAKRDGLVLSGPEV